MAPPAGLAASADDPAPTAQRDTRWMLSVSPSVAYELLVGEPPPGRVRGWVGAAQQQDHDAAWRVFGPALTEFARSHGFEAYRVTGQTPAGPAFELWRREFVATHSY